MTSTERMIYEHLRCIPVGMEDSALAFELAVVLGRVQRFCVRTRASVEVMGEIAASVTRALAREAASQKSKEGQ